MQNGITMLNPEKDQSLSNTKEFQTSRQSELDFRMMVSEKIDEKMEKYSLQHPELYTLPLEEYAKIGQRIYNEALMEVREATKQNV